MTEPFMINVDGRSFTTLKSTLEKSPFLNAMLSTKWAGSTCYVNGLPFVDRGPLLFEHILDFLRSSVPPIFWTRMNGFDLPLYASLVHEAEYFQLEALTTWIRNEQYINTILITSSLEVITLSDCGHGKSHSGDIEQEFEPGTVSKSGKSTTLYKRLLLRKSRLRLPIESVTTLIHYFYALPRPSEAALRIESVRDVSPLYEAFSEEDDEHGNPIFLYSSFGYISDNYTAYFGRSKLRKYDLTSKDIKESLELLPDEDVYPEAPLYITTSTIPIDSNVFLKGPRLHTDFVGTGLLPKLILQEVKILERLQHDPHPNIIRYHGCLIKRGRIVGIVLDRQPMTLEQRLKDDMRHLHVETLMGKITSAVSHIHALALAHNDLTPMNIVVDENDTPFIIDFGSCQPFGCELITAGTPGWINEDFTHSAQDHDEFALGKLRTWLDMQGRDGMRQ